MKQTSSEGGSSKIGKLSINNNASAISKQVLKNNPIPQPLINRHLDATNLVKPKTHPLRSSKVSQKLVLFPQSSTDSPDNMGIFQQDHDSNPSTGTLETSHLQQTTDRGGIQIGYVNDVNDEEHYQQQASTNDTDFWRPQHAHGIPLPMEWTFGSRTGAERMSKNERDVAQLPRVTAYCTGEAYDLARLRMFLRDYHQVSPRQYDEALYAAYCFPLTTIRPTVAWRRQQKRQENDQTDMMNYDEDHMHQEDSPVVDSTFPRPGYSFPIHQPLPADQYHQQRNDQHNSEQQETRGQSIPSATRKNEQNNYTGLNVDDNAKQYQQQQTEYRLLDKNDTQRQKEQGNHIELQHGEQQQQQQRQQQQKDQILHQKPNYHQQPFTGGEVFVFDYGVVVFWNFRRAEELLMLEDYADYSIGPFRDNPDEDFQIEEMHFQYDTSQFKPRIFNDMITMKTGNHMLKLTLSHGLSQSAVLARYEDIMDKTIEDTKYLPKEMAETGRLDKTRAEITTINGRLFNLRMNVNLVSNVLDTPEIFWSEPALQPMYSAIREYLEIPQRAKILNDRLRVISDLLSMLRDHLTNFGVEYQTLIIIYLIIIAVIVACFEIAVKILQSIKL